MGLAQPEVDELDAGAGLAGDQLRRGDVDRAARAPAEHPVEPPGADVGERDRERADPAAAVGLALQARDDRRDQLRLRRLEPDHLEPVAGPAGEHRLAVEPGPDARARRRTPPRRRSPRRSRSSTSAIEGPEATATLSANDGIVRRALSEPSIGSITTRLGAAVAERDLAALLGDRGELGAVACSGLELGEDDVLGLAVDDQAAVAALADRRRTRSGRRSRWCAAYSSRWAATIRRQAPSHASAGRPAASDRRHRGHARSVGRVPPDGHTPTAAQRRVAAHDGGPAAGPRRGRLGAHARRSCCGSRRSPRRGSRPERVLVLARSRAAALRASRAGRDALDRPHEELWIHTYEEAAEALLREYSIEAGLDPFFTTVGLARPARDPARPRRRAAAAPPRDPRQPGRPARPPAAPHRRAQVRGGRARGAARVGDRAASAPRRRAPPSASAPSARRSSPSSTPATTASCATPGSLDGGDLVLELGRLLAQARRRRRGRRRALRRAARGRARGRRHRPPADARRDRRPHGNLACACDPAQATRRWRGAAPARWRAFRAAHPEAVEVDLGESLRRSGGDPLLALRERSRPGPGGGARDRAPARRGRGREPSASA